MCPFRFACRLRGEEVTSAHGTRGGEGKYLSSHLRSANRTNQAFRNSMFLYQLIKYLTIIR